MEKAEPSLEQINHVINANQVRKKLNFPIFQIRCLNYRY